jgi:hypothetical protein
MLRRKFVTLVAGLALVLGLVVPAATTPAHAAVVWSCTAGGTLQVVNGNAFFAGQGSCLASTGLFWPMTFFAGGTGAVLTCLGGRGGVGVIGLNGLGAVVRLTDPYDRFFFDVTQRWSQLLPGLLGAPLYSAAVNVTNRGGGSGLMNGLSLLTSQCPNPRIATTQGPFHLVFTTNH